MRRIRVDQIGDYSEEQINTLLSVAVLTGDRIDLLEKELLSNPPKL